MNSIERAGLVIAMLHGKRTVVVAPSNLRAQQAAEEVWDTVMLLTRGNDVSFVRASGRDRICSVTTPGRIHFVSGNGHGVRGLSADMLILDESLPPAAIAEAMPVAAGRVDSEVVMTNV